MKWQEVVIYPLKIEASEAPLKIEASEAPLKIEASEEAWSTRVG